MRLLALSTLLLGCSPPILRGETMQVPSFCDMFGELWGDDLAASLVEATAAVLGGN